LIELNGDNASEYLQSRGHEGPWRVKALGGGVSNTVLLAESGIHRWVVKQSLGKLRVDEDWFADRSRIHRECSAMRELAPLLPEGVIPQVVFEDRDNYLYVMSAAASDARDWKSLLLAGTISTPIAESAGRILARIREVSRDGGQWARRFGDQTCFDQLRLDPYYRFAAARHPDLAGGFDAAIAAARRPIALVHGDFSPKNLLVRQRQVLLIDFEVIHFGDPAFDAAFLLNHLLLKCAHRPEFRLDFLRAAHGFWNEASAGAPPDFESSTILHLGCLHLARVDGKSRAEYLNEEVRVKVRAQAGRWIVSPPHSLCDLLNDAYRN
jgi:5-methylthioribose kinase